MNFRAPISKCFSLLQSHRQSKRNCSDLYINTLALCTQLRAQDSIKKTGHVARGSASTHKMVEIVKLGALVFITDLTQLHAIWITIKITSWSFQLGLEFLIFTLIVKPRIHITLVGICKNDESFNFTLIKLCNYWFAQNLPKKVMCLIHRALNKMTASLPAIFPNEFFN